MLSQLNNINFYLNVINYWPELFINSPTKSHGHYERKVSGNKIFIFMTMTKTDRSEANCVQADEAIQATRHKTPQI